MDFLIVIPARMESTRLPEKPLIDLCGKSLIERTYNQCLQAVPSHKIIVATDHEKIRIHCLERGMGVIMTSKGCLTGTDRVAEVASQIHADHYVNVQGDEPLINPKDILETIRVMKQFPDDIINGFAPVTDINQFNSLTIPKVVFRPDGRLLYMSRSPIPGNKRGVFQLGWRQICVYAFPYKSLMEFSKLTYKTLLENEEDIEILRFLEMGYEIRMIPLSADSVAVDTEEDAKKVRNILINERL